MQNYPNDLSEYPKCAMTQTMYPIKPTSYHVLLNVAYFAYLYLDHEPKHTTNPVTLG